MPSMTNNAGTVLRCAIASRILLLTLIILWRSLLSPYDTSASLNPTCLLSLSSQPAEPPAEPAVVFPSIASAIEGSIVWDSVYFVRIAQCGYEYEQTYAFFPLLPILMSLLSNTGLFDFAFFIAFGISFSLYYHYAVSVFELRFFALVILPFKIVLWPLVPLIGYRAVLGLSGYAISNVAFLFAAVYFYRLSVVLLKDPKASLLASILFCFNPASIFYSSIYTESLYALLSIGGLYHLMTGANNVPVLWFALSGSARSNGVLNAGYYGFKALHQAYYALYVKKRALLVLQVLFVGALRCICIFIPFLAFQAYGYYNMCHGRSQNDTRPWCKAKVPLLYSFIQSQYWGVGFLRYFQLKQLPNFLLASPVLSLAFCSIQSYLKTEPQKFFSLGFGAALDEENSAAVVFSGEKDLLRDNDQYTAKPVTKSLRHRLKNKTRDTPMTLAESEVSVKSGYYSVIVLPCIYHLAFMAVTSFFVMHVQVATRFLSASPPLYWFASYLIGYLGKRRWGYLIWAYAASYILLGSLLFSNFYPFT